MSNYSEWYEAIQAIKLEPSKIDQYPIRRYTVTITFETNRELTAEELDQVETELITQVLEPADQEGEGVDWESSSQVIETTMSKWTGESWTEGESK